MNKNKLRMSLIALIALFTICNILLVTNISAKENDKGEYFTEYNPPRDTEETYEETNDKNFRNSDKKFSDNSVNANSTIRNSNIYSTTSDSNSTNNDVSELNVCEQYNGTYENWYCRNNIPVNDWEYVDYIFEKESNHNMYAVNEESGAVGICQLNPNYHEIPTGFMLSVDNQISWCTGYMEDRYGTWENAYWFHVMNGWW